MVLVRAWVLVVSDHGDVTLPWFAAAPVRPARWCPCALGCWWSLGERRDDPGPVAGSPGSVASDEPAVRHGHRHARRDDRGLGGAAASGVRGHRPARTRLRAALRVHQRHRPAGGVTAELADGTGR